MLFISEKLKDVSVRPERAIFSEATGERVGLRRRVFAEFTRGGLPSWALEVGVRSFTMAARPADIPETQWLCAYDSVVDQRERGWTDEERKLIEEKLLGKPGVVLAERPKVSAPTPAYVKQTTPHGQRKADMCVKRAVEYVTDEGFDAETLIAFERQENRAVSKDIIAALQALSVVEVDELVAA